MRERAESRVVVVTGASRGIGRAIALDQLRRGRHVVVVGRDEGALDETFAGARESGTATCVVADSADPDTMADVGEAAVAQYGRLDAVVACAGVHGAEAPVEKLSSSQWMEALVVNVVAPAQLVRGCVPYLTANSDGGHILFVGSNAATRSPTRFAVYNATKAALHSLMRTLSRELDESSVAVNELRPGPTNTSLLGLQEEGRATTLLGGINRAFGREWIKGVEDVAQAAAFLLELPSAGTTGQTLTLNRYE